jgi:hypothetical protein
MEAHPRAIEAQYGPVEVYLGAFQPHPEHWMLILGPWRSSWGHGAHPGAVQAYPGAFLAHSGAMEAQPGPFEDYLLAIKPHPGALGLILGVWKYPKFREIKTIFV